MSKKHQIIVSSSKGRTNAFKKWRRKRDIKLRMSAKAISIHDLKRNRIRRERAIAKGIQPKESLESYTI